MAIDTVAVDRALGAIGLTFRLARQYPASHPAVLESMKQIKASLAELAALGTVELKVGTVNYFKDIEHENLNPERLLG